MLKEFICINCPLGCRLTVELEGNQVLSVVGNTCKRGFEYAAQEAVLPARVLTGNMKAQGSNTPFSVKTDRPVPKQMLLACAMELKRHHPSLPIHSGDIIISNILNTGANVIATRGLVRS